MITNELQHHGILGQKWGIRRFQNKDGSLTAKGRKRYSGDSSTSKETGSEGFHLSDKQLLLLV